MLHDVDLIGVMSNDDDDDASAAAITLGCRIYDFEASFGITPRRLHADGALLSRGLAPLAAIRERFLWSSLTLGKNIDVCATLQRLEFSHGFRCLRLDRCRCVQTSPSELTKLGSLIPPCRVLSLPECVSSRMPHIIAGLNGATKDAVRELYLGRTRYRVNAVESIVSNFPNLCTVVVGFHGDLTATVMHSLLSKVCVVNARNLNSFEELSVFPGNLPPGFTLPVPYDAVADFDSANEQEADSIVRDVTSERNHLDLDDLMKQESYLLQREFWDLERLKTLVSSFHGSQRKIRVAILDSGMSAMTLPNLLDKVTLWRSFVRGSAACVDELGHGTSVSSLIADDAVGIAPHVVELIILKVLDENNNCPNDSIPLAIDFARRERADLISLSVTWDHSSRFQRSFFRALASNIIFVCSTTNQGRRRRRNVQFPARYGGALCVGGHDANGQGLPMSAVGQEVDVLALGANLWTACEMQPHYKVESGVSFATPLVSGLCCLILAYDRLHDGKIRGTPMMRAVIHEMAVMTGHHDEIIGYGAIDIERLFPNDDDVPNDTILALFRSILTQIK